MAAARAQLAADASSTAGFFTPGRCSMFVFTVNLKVRSEIISFASIFRFHLAEIGSICSQQTCFLGSKFTKNACVAAIKCRSAPLGESNSALPNPLTGFEGPLRGGGKRGGREGKRKGTEETGENILGNKLLCLVLVSTAIILQAMTLLF